jgi:hypothetical protein
MSPSPPPPPPPPLHHYLRQLQPSRPLPPPVHSKSPPKSITLPSNNLPINNRETRPDRDGDRHKPHTSTCTPHPPIPNPQSPTPNAAAAEAACMSRPAYTYSSNTRKTCFWSPRAPVVSRSAPTGRAWAGPINVIGVSQILTTYVCFGEGGFGLTGLIMAWAAWLCSFTKVRSDSSAAATRGRGWGTAYCNVGMGRCCRREVVLGSGADGLVPSAWMVGGMATCRYSGGLGSARPLRWAGGYGTPEEVGGGLVEVNYYY